MIERCPKCKGRSIVRTVERSRRVAGHEFTARLPARVCTSCGEAFFLDTVVATFDLLVGARLAQAGVNVSEALKFIRKVTGLNGRQFAELLDVRPETVSRWERGRRPIDRATYALIRHMMFDRKSGTPLATPCTSRSRPTTSVISW